MDRRGFRVVLVLAVAAVPALVVLAPRANPHGQDAAARNVGDPSAFVPGSSSFDGIQPTHIPGSSTWNDILATPTGSPSSTADPRPSKKPGHSGAPTLTRSPGPTLGPTSNPTLGPTFAPSANPVAPPTAKPTVKPTVAPTPKPTTAPTPPPTPKPTPNPVACTLFPSDNVWNRRVDALPVRADSATLMGSIGASAALHPDFSSTAWNGGLGYGIPFNKVNLSTPTSSVHFQYASESDAGPYPIPASPKIEGGSDAHLLLWDTEGCNLYEIFDASKSGGQWYGGSGSIWDLRSNALRPNGWTSADAAGLPILPGLARYDEVAAGAIHHALRFTAPRTCSSHIYPARHDAGSYSCSTYPPMGLRIRLKASVDLSGFGPQAQVILLALKRYGMLLADNGSAMYVTGAPNANWDDDQLHDFGQLHGSDFEAVDTSSLRNG
jgi:hypothetical protein